jgi:membrane protein
MMTGMPASLASWTAGTIASVEELFDQGRGGVLTASILLALWALSRGFAAAIRALNLAYGVSDRRPWLRLRALALVLSLGSVVMAALILATLVAGPLLGGGRAVADALRVGEAFAFAWNWLRWPVAAVILVAWATTLYHVAPNKRSAWRGDIPGGILVAALWLGVSVGFGAYLRVAAEGNPVMGILGGALIMLLWLYLLSLALLIGGEFNAVLRAGKWKETTQ